MSNGRIELIIDTSEPVHTAWEFDANRFVCKRESLETGDYSIRGLEHSVTIERKTLGDAVNTVIHGWMRFRKELYRMAGMDYGIVVIEASVEDILAKNYESDAEPLSVLGKLNAITIDHGIPVVFAGSREFAMLFADRYLTQTFSKAKR
jgi:ERCC4-type nuclease